MSPSAGCEVCDAEEVVDDETGEAVSQCRELQSAPGASAIYEDCETGEQPQLRMVYQRSKFKVPRSALKLPVFESAVQMNVKPDSWDLTLLILPLLVLVPGWAIILYLMAEVMYHHWSHAHERTHQLCKTPMRVLFKATCAECVSHNQMQKVGRLQDARTSKINSRRILNYDYAQFGIGS